VNTILNDYGTFKMVAYKSTKYSNNHNEKEKWFAFPSLNYLPTDVKKVLTRDGGLLVCCGGRQPCQLPIQGERLLFLTHDEDDDYDRDKYPKGQLIILVTNPLVNIISYLQFQG